MEEKYLTQENISYLINENLILILHIFSFF